MIILQSRQNLYQVSDSVNPICGWKNQGPKELSNLTKVSQLEKCGVGFKFHGVRFQSALSHYVAQSLWTSLTMFRKSWYSPSTWMMMFH